MLVLTLLPPPYAICCGFLKVLTRNLCEKILAFDHEGFPVRHPSSYSQLMYTKVGEYKVKSNK